MMHNIKVQTEALQLSIYCNIICQMLQTHRTLSIYKTLAFSYLIKQNKFIGTEIYTARNSKNVVYKGISFLSGDFDGFCNSIAFILKALHILIKNDMVHIEKDVLFLNGDANFKTDIIYEESNFMKKAIEESKSMTDRQFIKEVMFNV